MSIQWLDSLCFSTPKSI